MIRDIIHAIQRPHVIARKLDTAWYSKLGMYETNPDGKSIFEYDWDNLIILDACRHDVFSEVIDIDGKLSFRRTLGTATPQYVPANFAGRDLKDTVILSVNGWYRKKLSGIDTEIHNLIDIETMDLPSSAYDSDFGIPLPSIVTQQAIEAAETYSDKRLIVHHNQPHYPYLGEYGRSLFTESTSALPNAIRARNETTDPSEVQAAYRENLEFILDEVKKLLPNLEGKTVITSDHGEMLGERHTIMPVRDYGHPSGIYNEELTCVPWFIIDTGVRKDITKSDSHKVENSSKKTEENLRALGYM